MATVPIRLVNDSIVVRGLVDGDKTVFVLDTGDAVGPVFSKSDAFRLGLTEGAAEGVSGAGGASNVYQTTANITFDDMSYPDEPCAIDTSLQGQSLIGLPFFLRTCSKMEFDFVARTLSLTAKAPKPEISHAPAEAYVPPALPPLPQSEPFPPEVAPEPAS